MALKEPTLGESSHTHADDVVSAETEIYRQQLQQAARQEARAHQEDQCRRELRDHQTAAEPRAVCGSPRLPGSALQPDDQVWAGGSEGRRQAERNSCEQGEPGSEREHGRIEMDVHCLDRPQRCGVHEQWQTERRYDEPGGRSEDRQHHALGQELARQPEPAAT